MARPKLRDEELRGRLLNGALELVAQGGPPAITTRAVAASAGTSIGSVHELFGGKGGLVRAMFVEGFERLGRELSALPEATDVEAGVMDVALAIRDFARRQPQLFEVMFSRPFAEFDPEPEDLAAGEATYRIVVSRVGRFLGDVVSNAERKDAAIALTAVFEGLARTELAGRLGSSARVRERRWNTSVLSMMYGLRQRTNHAISTGAAGI